jgi:hypothetical protein
MTLPSPDSAPSQVTASETGAMAEHAPECNRRMVLCDCGEAVCYCNLLGHVGCKKPMPKEWPPCPGCDERELYCPKIHDSALGYLHTEDCLLSCYVCQTRISFRSLTRLVSASKREGAIEAHLQDARIAEEQRAKRGWMGDRVCAASTAKWYDGFDRAKAEIAAVIRAKAGEEP